MNKRASKHVTAPVCPVNTLLSLLIVTSVILIFPSDVPDAINLPSGAHSNAVTGVSLCFTVCTQSLFVDADEICHLL